MATSRSSPIARLASRERGRLLRRARADRQLHADPADRLARAQRARRALGLDTEARQRRGGAREVVCVVDADAEREQAGERRRLDAQLLAAVGAREAAGSDLVEAE